jgi:hypothetical protein
MPRRQHPETGRRRFPLQVRKRAEGGAKVKGKTMRLVSRIALLAALGIVAVTLPAAAVPAVPGGTDVRPAKPALMQFAQKPRDSDIREAYKKKKEEKAKEPKKKKTY